MSFPPQMPGQQWPQGATASVQGPQWQAAPLQRTGAVTSQQSQLATSQQPQPMQPQLVSRQQQPQPVISQLPQPIQPQPISSQQPQPVISQLPQPMQPQPISSQQPQPVIRQQPQLVTTHSAQRLKGLDFVAKRQAEPSEAAPAPKRFVQAQPVDDDDDDDEDDEIQW
jgi:cell division protein FtsN